MTDDDPRRTSNVPNDALLSISTKLTEVATGVDNLCTTQLPPIAKAAGEARDGVIELRGWQRDTVRRVEVLEACEDEQNGKLDAHSGALTAQEKEVAGLSKWRWWVMGITVTATLFAATLAGRALLAQGEASSDRTGLRRDVDRHEGGIKAIREGADANRDEIIREVKAVPKKVQTTLPEPSLDDALEEYDLRDREERFIREILRRAEKRNGKAHP
jgi:hypothetical protein